jgi:hypothetical protein
MTSYDLLSPPSSHTYNLRVMKKGVFSVLLSHSLPSEVLQTHALPPSLPLLSISTSHRLHRLYQYHGLISDTELVGMNDLANTHICYKCVEAFTYDFTASTSSVAGSPSVLVAGIRH